MTRALLLALALPVLALAAIWILAIYLAGSAARVGERVAGT